MAPLRPYAALQPYEWPGPSGIAPEDEGKSVIESCKGRITAPLMPITRQEPENLGNSASWREQS